METRKRQDLRLVKAAAATALSTGLSTMTRTTEVEWTCSGSCTQPRRLERYGRPDGVVKPGTGKPLTLVTFVRCGVCFACKMARKNRWARRVLNEALKHAVISPVIPTIPAVHRPDTEDSKIFQEIFPREEQERNVYARARCRIWAGTLTMSPDYLRRVVHLARHELAPSGVDFDALTPQRQFRIKDRVIYRDISKFWKRLRRAGALFKHLTVTEAHKSGEPHYHCLIHEADNNRPIRKESLKSAHWVGGFTKFNLVEGEPRKLLYSLKYLIKEGGRVRASRQYGLP